MKIALFKTDGFRVGWLLSSPSEMRVRLPFKEKLPNHQGSIFSGINGILPEKSGLIVECHLITPQGPGFGFAACSYEDKFSFGKGMKLSLEKAIDMARGIGGYGSNSVDARDLDTKPLWDALLADGVLGRAIRNENERVIRHGIQDRIGGILHKISA